MLNDTVGLYEMGRVLTSKLDMDVFVYCEEQLIDKPKSYWPSVSQLVKETLINQPVPLLYHENRNEID